MADLTARFKLIDELSDKLASMADRGQQMVTSFEDAGDAANSAFGDMESGLSSAVSSADGVATSIADINSAAGDAASSAENLADSFGEYENAAEKAAEQTDYWTSAVGNYDKGALEAIYTTEELVDMGFKSADALEAEQQAMQEAEQAAGRLADAQEDLGKQTEDAADKSEDAGKKGTDAIESIAGALAAAGITAKVTEIAQAAYELVDAFSEAESTVVKATGASGDALDGLMQSTMEVYATAKSGDMDSISSAIGEINTRMGLTGSELTDVTNKFMDYANITGTNVVGSVQNVTKVMNQWGVEASDMESLMDKLAYAGQISGISVDNLSSTLITGAASFQNAGLSLDNTIQMLADFELAGINSTTAITAMRTAVNNFSKDGLDANTALQEVITQIATMENQSDATALAVETFGSRAGQQLALAIQNGTVSIDTFNSTMDKAQGTLTKTAETSQTLSEKWNQANRSMEAAFTSALQPTLDKVSSGLADIVAGIGNFLNEHPAFTKAITAIGVGLGVAVGAFAAYEIASGIATAATALFGTTLSAAIWPLTAIAAAVAAVTAAVFFLIDAFEEDLGETEGMTAATRDQYYAVQDLNSQYEEAVAKYGENSEEALRLKYQLDDLNASFEANRQTVEEFTAEVDNLCTSASELSSQYDQNITSINTEETGALSLIQKLQDLATQSNRTAVEQKELEALTNKLATAYPELGVSIESVTENTEGMVDAMKRACEQQAEQQRLQEAEDTYIAALQKRQELTDEIAKAQENINLEQERMDNMSGWTHFWTGGEWDDLEAYQAALEELQAAEAENNATIAEIEQQWQDIADAEEEAAEQTMSYEEAAATAYQSVQEEIEELCAAYDEAYEAAKSSFEGQFGLFDEASTTSEEYMNATVANAQAALDSQLAYWDSYLANVQVLKDTSAEDLGITQENYDLLMSYVQDGSEEAAGLANSMVEAIQNGNTEAVAELANTAGEVQSTRETIAAETADWQTNFNATMDELVQKMDTTVDELNLDSEASASAKATIDAYANQIRTSGGAAVQAAQSIADQVSAALASARTTVNVGVSAPGHARGTTNAENVFVAGEQGHELIVRAAEAYANGTTNSTGYYLAGENGPELIIGQQGSTVFPTEETDRIINALDERRRPLNITADTGGRGESSRMTAGEQIKRIILEIAGSGSIDVGSGANTETVLSILQEHLKPVLMNLIQSEIYEEGDLSYDY